jgi:uncharacterized protein (TIGR00251 family)
MKGFMMAENDFVRGCDDGAFIEISVRTGSSRQGISGISGGRIAVSVHSHPEKGKANREVLKVLSGALGLPPSRLEVVSGKTSRKKTILAHGIVAHEARERLKPPTDPT